LKSEFIYDKYEDFPQYEYLPEVHSSCIIECPNGDLLCSFFAGERENALDVGIHYARKRKGAPHWDPPILLSKTPNVSMGNPCFWIDRDNKTICAAYTIKSKPPQRMIRKSLDNGHTWTEEQLLAHNFTGKNKPIRLGDETLLSPLTYWGKIALTCNRKRLLCAVAIANDFDDHWDTISFIEDTLEVGCIQPTLTLLSDGTVLALLRSWSGKICESRSNDGGRSWTPIKKTVLNNPCSGIDMVRLKSGEIVLAYNNSTCASGKPGPRTPLSIAVSRDEGTTWSSPLNIEDGPGEYSYPSIIQTKDGDIHITYTWRRKKIKHVSLTINELP